MYSIQIQDNPVNSVNNSTLKLTRNSGEEIQCEQNQAYISMQPEFPSHSMLMKVKNPVSKLDIKLKPINENNSSSVSSIKREKLFLYLQEAEFTDIEAENRAVFARISLGDVTRHSKHMDASNKIAFQQPFKFTRFSKVSRLKVEFIAYDRDTENEKFLIGRIKLSIENMTVNRLFERNYPFKCFGSGSAMISVRKEIGDGSSSSLSNSINITKNVMQDVLREQKKKRDSLFGPAIAPVLQQSLDDEKKDSVDISDVEKEEIIPSEGFGRLLLCKIISASDLEASDWCSKLSDPFVMIVFGNCTFHTLQAEKTVNPTWNESFIMHIHPNDDTYLELSVVDINNRLFGKNQIGFLKLEVSNIHSNQVLEKTYRLDGAKSGNITLSLFSLDIKNMKQYQMVQSLSEQRQHLTKVQEEFLVTIPQ